MCIRDRECHTPRQGLAQLQIEEVASTTQASDAADAPQEHTAADASPEREEKPPEPAPEPASARPPCDAFPESGSTGSAPQPVCAPCFTLRDAQKLARAATGTRDLQGIRAAYELFLQMHETGYEVGGQQLVSAPCPELDWQLWFAVRFREWVEPGIERCYWQFRSKCSNTRTRFGLSLIHI